MILWSSHLAQMCNSNLGVFQFITRDLPGLGMWCTPNRIYVCLSKSFYIHFLLLSSRQSAERSMEVPPSVMCRETGRWLSDREGFAIFDYWSNYHFWSKNPNDVRMTSSSLQRKTAHKNPSSVIDLGEDQQKQHSVMYLYAWQDQPFYSL